MRDDITSIINKMFSRSIKVGAKKNKSEMMLYTPVLEKRSSVIVNSTDAEWSEGVMYEEALTRCGNGPDRMKRVVARGRLKATGIGDDEDPTHHFKRSRSGHAATYSRTTEMKKADPATIETWKTFNEASGVVLDEEPIADTTRG